MGTSVQRGQENKQTAANIASFAFLKGGSSKTTLAVNTARHLAERNGDGSTLLIDWDSEGHATKNYDYGHNDSLYDRDSDTETFVLGEQPDRSPTELTLETQFGFDFLPAATDYERLANGLKSEMGASARLKTRIVDELESEYEYILIDQPSERGIMNNNATFCSRSLILPMLPKAETIGAFRDTKRRLITPLEERDVAVDILALVPNLLGKRIDQQTVDRELLETLNTSDSLKHYIPKFARITEREWEQIDEGEITPPKPGIRKTDDITRGMKQEGLPLLDYAPGNSQNEHFDALAAIVEQGGVNNE